MVFPIGKVLRGGWWLVKNLDAILAIWEEIKKIQAPAKKTRKEFREALARPSMDESVDVLRAAADTLDAADAVIDKMAPIIDELQKRITPKNKRHPEG